MKATSLVRLTLFLLLAAGAGTARATGYFGPMVYLADGGRNVAASPEFFWELEVKRLARDFHPPEKLGPDDLTEAEADERDFATSLENGLIKPPDPAQAKLQDAWARAVLDRTSPMSSEPLPAEFPSEFADYHRGAFAYRRGPTHWEEARRAWNDLLRRPVEERRFRSTWAAYMLGKVALKEKNPAAAGWFQKTRELGSAGLADSLGLAAASYGWEGRSEWKEQHPEKAATLFLTQLALGDESAIVSLKALIPDRAPSEGMLNYDPLPAEEVLVQLKRAAQDPLLRRLVTVHILATGSVPDEFRYDANNATPERRTRWLRMIQDLKLKGLEDAEYIGWLAYNGGDYSAARHWLELAKKDSPAASWLRAKLQRRAGN